MKSRKINRAKRVDKSCCNNGSCKYCQDSRTYSNRHREPILPKGSLIYAAEIAYDDEIEMVISNPDTSDYDDDLTEIIKSRTGNKTTAIRWEDL